MKVYTLSDIGPVKATDIVVYLAGGIHNENWRDKVISLLSEKEGVENLVVINPVPNEDDDETRSCKEIAWINKCDIFAAYLENNGSKHPMTLFELGYAMNMPNKSIAVTCENGYDSEKLSTMLDYANTVFDSKTGFKHDMDSAVDENGVRRSDSVKNHCYMYDEEDGTVEEHAEMIYEMYKELF